MKRICALLTALLLSLCVTVPALASDYGAYVYDPDDILTEEDREALGTAAERLTDTYDCAVYIFLMNDFTDYGYDDLYEFAQDYYEENLLGCGEDRDGILLTLSTGLQDMGAFDWVDTDTRAVSLAVYGPWAQTVFTDAAQDILWDAFLEEFGNDNWYGGCQNYLTTCETLLSDAQNAIPAGNMTSDYGYDDVYPVRKDASIGAAMGKAVAMSILPAVVIAFLVCGVMKRNMKTARKASGAAAYVSSAVDLKVRTDHYTHSTVVRTPIKTDAGPKGGGPRLGGGPHGGGGHHTSVNSRGFSGRSRKF